MSTVKRIKELEQKFLLINEKIKVLVNESEKNKQLLTKIDFIKAIGLDIEEYDLLVDYNDIEDLTDEQTKQLMRLNDELEKKLKYIQLINEKIVLSCNDYKKINKNTITYLLNKDKKSQERQNVIINVHMEGKPEEHITTERLLKENEKG